MTLATLHTDFTSELAFWQAQIPECDLAGLAAMEDVYTAWLLEEARYVIYPATRFDRETQAFRTDARREREAAALATEAWLFVHAVATSDKDALDAFALNAARATTFWVGGDNATAASKAVRAIITKALRGRDAHREDIEAEVSEKAAHYISAGVTAGAAAPVSGNVEEHMPLMDVFGLAGLLEYLHALGPALAAADRSELALTGANLRRDTVRALDDLTYAVSGLTVDEKDAARSLAAHRSNLAGMTDEERVVAEAERITKNAAEKRPERVKAAAGAHTLLDSRSSASVDALSESGFDIAEADDDEPEAPRFEVQDGAWDALAADFDFEDGTVFKAVIADRIALDAKAAGDKDAKAGNIAALTGDAKSAETQRLRKRAKALDMDAVRTALSAVLV